MEWRSAAEFFAMCLPEAAGDALNGFGPGELREIRVRAGSPIVFATSRGSVRLNARTDAREVAAIAEALSEHALYARVEEAKQGFITLRGGHRMGLCGQAISSGQTARSLHNVSSLCVRVAGEWPGAADCLMPYLTGAERGVAGMLIIGPPGSGKTTLLRDACRQLSGMGVAVCVSDERGEIAACSGGEPQLAVGENTDVLCGVCKAVALGWLTRSMSPEAIVTDELGGHMDAQAVLDAVKCGVAVLASAHGRELEAALSRAELHRLARERAFGLYAVLDGKQPGRVAAIYDEQMRPVEVPS